MESIFQRIKNNVWPFFLMGLLTGTVINVERVIKSNKLLSKYFEFAGIDSNILSTYLKIILEHIAPITLSLALALIFLFSAFHRLICGKVEAENRFIKFVILPMEKFASSLAIALLGILLGFSVVAIALRSEIGALSLATCFYPIFYLILLHLSVNIMFMRNAPIVNKMPAFIKDRFDGLALLIISFLVLTFHRQLILVVEWISGLISWIIAFILGLF